MAAKNFRGAPFGTQTARFDVAGIHPQSKIPGTFTQSPYCKKSLSWAKLSPGCYNIDARDSFNGKEVALRAEGPGWARQYHVAQLAKLPHLLHRDEAKRTKDRITRLGPGTYNHTDFIQQLEHKPRSTVGVCATKAKRFVSKAEEVPGPGTYGNGGIPHAASEQRQAQSSSTIGMLDSGSTLKREIPSVGCELSPTRYKKKTFTQHILNKVVSKRGPYDLFTGSRSKPIVTGHLSVNPASLTLGPGSYNLPSFVDEWDKRQKKKHGAFSKLHVDVDRTSQTAGERIYQSTLSQCPRPASEPGPGQYSPRVFSINVSDKKPNAPAFGSSANRYREEKPPNNVGAGRYDMSKYYSCSSKKTNGSKWVFNSSTKRFVGHERQIYLTERIQPKGIQPSQRTRLTD